MPWLGLTNAPWGTANGRRQGCDAARKVARPTTKVLQQVAADLEPGRAMRGVRQSGVDAYRIDRDRAAGTPVALTTVTVVV